MVAVTGSGTTELKEKNHVPYIQFKNLSATGIVKHGFSTRKGGVSTGIFSSMNLNFKRGDDPDAVMENYRRMAAALNMRVEDMVLSDQTHTTNVRVITEEDRGKGILKPQDYSDVDGMITNVPGIVLVTSYADCVPLYFVDPVRKAKHPLLRLPKAITFHPLTAPAAPGHDTVSHRFPSLAWILCRIFRSNRSLSPRLGIAVGYAPPKQAVQKPSHPSTICSRCSTLR